MVEFSDDFTGKYADYLDDESSIAKGTSASRIWFPSTHDEVAEVVDMANRSNTPVTISGGGTGISGGRAPNHGWIVATDKMLTIEDENYQSWTDTETGITYGVKFFNKEGHDFFTVPVGMTLKAVLNCTREHGLLYPPDPTERTSFLGGNFATNASGARSFKFGPTRNWIQSAKIVLASGESIFLDRSDNSGSPRAGHISFSSGSRTYDIPIPEFKIPKVTKHVAGPVLTSSSHPIDIFIGTNGIFGVVTEITLKLLPSPLKIISMFVFCDTMDQVFRLIAKCRELRDNNGRPMPMSVELLDKYSIKIMQQKDKRITDAESIILLEQDVYSEEEEDEILEQWQEIFDDIGIEDISVALDHKENEHHKFLRHWVPEYLIKTTKDYGYPLVVSDTSVPHEKFREFTMYLEELANQFRQNSDDELSTCLLGHVGDSHPHLALIPENDQQAKLSQSLLLQLIDKTVELGGSIAAEHGLGKKLFGGQPAIIKQYGQYGVDAVNKMKEVLDPNYLLCPGNVVPLK